MLTQDERNTVAELLRSVVATNTSPRQALAAFLPLELAGRLREGSPSVLVEQALDLCEEDDHRRTPPALVPLLTGLLPGRPEVVPIVARLSAPGGPGPRRWRRPGRAAWLAIKNHPVRGGVVAALVLIVVAAGVVWVPSELDARQPIAYQVLTGGSDDDPSKGFCDNFAIVGPPEQVPPPADVLIPTRADEQAWIARVGGVDAGAIRVEIRLQGKTSQTVRLESPTIVSDARGPAQTENLFAYRYGCGGTFAPRYYSVDLDSETRLTAESSFENDQQRPGVPFRFEINNAEPETVVITARARNLDHRWHLEVPWYSGERRGILRIDAPTGEPFTTLGDAAARNLYIPNQGRWERIDPILDPPR